jgi:hypothetical protein
VTDPTPQAMQAWQEAVDTWYRNRKDDASHEEANASAARIIDEVMDAAAIADVERLKADIELSKSTINAMVWQCAKFHEAVALLRRWKFYADHDTSLFGKHFPLGDDTDVWLIAIDVPREPT